MVKHSPPTSEVSGSNPDPMWERWWFLTDGQHFSVQNFDRLYVLISSAHEFTRCDMTYTVLKGNLKPR